MLKKVGLALLLLLAGVGLVFAFSGAAGAEVYFNNEEGVYVAGKTYLQYDSDTQTLTVSNWLTGMLEVDVGAEQMVFYRRNENPAPSPAVFELVVDANAGSTANTNDRSIDYLVNVAEGAVIQLAKAPADHLRSFTTSRNCVIYPSPSVEHVITSIITSGGANLEIGARGGGSVHVTGNVNNTSTNAIHVTGDLIVNAPLIAGTNNTTYQYGNAIYVGDQLTINAQVTAYGCSNASSAGNGIVVGGSSGAMTDSIFALTIATNSVEAYGGTNSLQGNGIYVTTGDMTVNGRTLGKNDENDPTVKGGNNSGQGNGVYVQGMLNVTNASVFAKGGDGTTGTPAGNGIYMGASDVFGTMRGWAGSGGELSTGAYSQNGVYCSGLLNIGDLGNGVVYGKGGDNSGGTESGNGIFADGTVRILQRGTLTGDGGNSSRGTFSGNGVYTAVIGFSGVNGTITGNGGKATQNDTNGNGVIVGGMSTGNEAPISLDIIGNGGVNSTSGTAQWHEGPRSGNGIYFSYSGRFPIGNNMAFTGTGSPNCHNAYSGNGIYFAGGAEMTLSSGSGSPKLIGTAKENSAESSNPGGYDGCSGNGVYVGGVLSATGSSSTASSITGNGASGIINDDNSGNGVFVVTGVDLAGAAKIEAYASADSLATVNTTGNNSGRSANGLASAGYIRMGEGSVVEATGRGGKRANPGETATSASRWCGNGVFAWGNIELAASSEMDQTIIATGGDYHGGENSGNGVYAGTFVCKDTWAYQNAITAKGGNNWSNETGKTGCGIVTAVTGSVDIFIGGDSVLVGGTKEGSTDKADAIVTGSRARLSNSEWTNWNAANFTAESTRTGPALIDLKITFTDVGTEDQRLLTGENYRVYALLHDRGWGADGKEWSKEFGILEAVPASTEQSAATIQKRNPADTGGINLTSDDAFLPSPIIVLEALTMRTKGTDTIKSRPQNYFFEFINLYYGTDPLATPSASLSESFGKFVPENYGIDLVPPNGSLGNYEITIQDVTVLYFDPIQYWCNGDSSGRTHARSYSIEHRNSSRTYTYNDGLESGVKLFTIADSVEYFDIVATNEAGTPSDSQTATYRLKINTGKGTFKPIGLDLTWELLPSNDKAMLTAVTNYTGNGAENLYYTWYEVDINGKQGDAPIDSGKGLYNLEVDLAPGMSYNFRVVISETDGGQPITDGTQNVSNVRAGGSADTLSARIISSSRTSTTTGQLFAAADGPTGYTLQWHRSETSNFTPSEETEIWGANAVLLNDSGLTAGKGYYYKLVATAGDQTVTSSQAMLSANPPPGGGNGDTGTGDLRISSNPGLPTSLSKTSGAQTYLLSATGGTGTITYTIDPSNTAGVTLSGRALTIDPSKATGNNLVFEIGASDSTPIAEEGPLTGALPVVVTLTSGNGNGNGGGSGSLSISTSSSLSNLPTNAASTLTFTASGGTSPYKNWAVTNATGALNGKISMNATTGVATIASGVAAGQYSFSVSVADSTTPTAVTATQTFNVGIGTAAADPSPSSSLSPSPSPSSSSKLTADSITITGTPANNQMYVGDKITLVPTLASGLTRSTSKWEYDTTYFTLSASGETATFTAKKAGTTQILYSVTDTSGATATKTINVTILPRVGLPQTGQDDRWPTAMLWAGAMLLLLAPFAERIKKKLLPLIRRK